MNEKLVEIASSYDGCGAGSDPERFVELMGLDGAWRKASLKPYIPSKKQGISTCGLVSEGLLYMAGLPVPAAWRPYAPLRAVEHAIARAQQWAISTGRLRHGRPEIGSYVCIGAGLHTHALLVTGYARNDDGSEALLSIDGGMCDDRGLQCIKAKRRGLDGGMLGDRRINWSISTG